MRRGTTPTLTFHMPIDPALCEAISVALAQGKTLVLEKTKKDCQINGFDIKVHLSQEDTLALSADRRTEIQLRAKTMDGDCLASDIFVVATERLLKDGEI